MVYVTWLHPYKKQLKNMGLLVFLILLFWSGLMLLRAYNATGQCLSSFSIISESEMKRRVVKSFVAHYLEYENQHTGSRRNRRVMFLDRSVTQQELINLNKSGTLLHLLNEHPLLLSDENQLNQYAAKIDSGEFTIFIYYPETSYTLSILIGKSLHRASSEAATDFFQKEYIKKITNNLDGYINNIGNYLFEFDYYDLDTACCNGKNHIDEQRKVAAKKVNAGLLSMHQIPPESHWYFVTTNCGGVLFAPHPQDEE